MLWLMMPELSMLGLLIVEGAVFADGATVVAMAIVAVLI